MKASGKTASAKVRCRLLPALAVVVPLLLFSGCASSTETTVETQPSSVSTAVQTSGSPTSTVPAPPTTEAEDEYSSQALYEAVKATGEVPARFEVLGYQTERQGPPRDGDAVVVHVAYGEEQRETVLVTLERVERRWVLKGTSLPARPADPTETTALKQAVTDFLEGFDMSREGRESLAAEGWNLEEVSVFGDVVWLSVVPVGPFEPINVSFLEEGGEWRLLGHPMSESYSEGM